MAAVNTLEVAKMHQINPNDSSILSIPSQCSPSSVESRCRQLVVAEGSRVARRNPGD